MGIFSWFKSKMFGGQVIRTVGTVKGKKSGMVDVELRVHVIEGKSPEEKHLVGLELVAKSPLSYQMMPCTLSSGESRRLIDFLNMAVQ